MKEFKRITSPKETRYVLESMTAGATGSSSIATAEKSLGELQKRQSVSVPVNQKPRQGPLRPQTGGGAHRDKKKEQKQGKEKHRKPFAEGHQDHEVEMAQADTYQLAKQALALHKMLMRASEMQGLEGWQQAKITKAADYINAVYKNLSHDVAMDGDIDEGVAGPKNCWPGHRKVGTKPGTGKNAGKRVNDCEKIKETDVDESGLQYHTGVKKHGKKYMDMAAAAGRRGASQEELGRLKDRYSKAYKKEDAYMESLMNQLYKKASPGDKSKK